MAGIKATLEAKIGTISNKEFSYAVSKLENLGVTVREDSPSIILDRLSTYIDDYRRGERSHEN